MRNIAYTSSNGKKLQVDLYDLLFKNKRPTIHLHANDVIYVNNIGSVVAITNGVNTPGIYEILPSETVSDLIYYAGGETPGTDLSVLTIQQYNPSIGQKSSKDIVKSQLKKQTMTNGDVLYLRSKYQEAQDMVTLEGNVKHPVTMAYKEGMKLSDLINGETELLDETFLHQAIITRITGDEREKISIPVSLKDLFSGKEDIALQPQDVVTVYKNSQVSYVTVSGAINQPKRVPYKPGLTLGKVMTGVQFELATQSDFQNETNANTIFDNQNIDKDKVAVLEGETKTDSQQAVQIQYTPVDVSDVAVEITNAAGNTSIYYLYDIMVASNQVNSIGVGPGSHVFFRPLKNNELVKSVNVSGFVNRPGVYKFVKGQKLTDILKTAGGLADGADLRGIVLNRRYIEHQQEEIALDSIDKDVREIETSLTGSGITASSNSDTVEDIKNSLESSNAAVSCKRIHLKDQKVV